MYDRVPSFPAPPAMPSPWPGTSRLSPSRDSSVTSLPLRGVPRPRVAVTQSEDPELLAQARTGDAAAFAVLYDRHAAAAFGLARRILRSQAAAEDVVQESFLALWRTNSYRHEKGTVRTFLLSIVHNRAIDALRRNRPGDGRVCIDDVPPARLPAGAHTDEEVERREAARLVRADLAALPQPQQRALELAYFGGFTHAEIARRLGEPLGTIKSRIRLGLERLRVQSDGAPLAKIGSVDCGEGPGTVVLTPRDQAGGEYRLS